MSSFKMYQPVVLDNDEQVVLTVDGRILPSITDYIFILLFAPMWFFAPLLVLHRLFRPVSYMITTKRVLVLEPSGQLDAIEIDEIAKMQGTKTALMISGDAKCLWLTRLPDA
ncbi:hypothetical protein [uncultured Roseobacter sp.]|uniref:hypothetical protein n=1 Tax=uncultured Roseobacter sp. TaxID=114847 RepID=UPI0026146055|nr:hypothetical protein [uncultured Roseobacter sp.]